MIINRTLKISKTASRLNTIKIAIMMLLNLLVGLIAFGLSRYGITGRLIGLSLGLLYSIGLYVINNKDDRPWILIILIWQFTFMLDLMYRIVRFDNTPFELLYIFDILAFLFLFKQIKLITPSVLIKDKALLLITLLLIIGGISSLINKSNFIDYLNAARLLFRCLGFYIYSSKKNIMLPRWLKFFFIISIIAFVLECIFAFNVDFRNGLFGYDATGAMFPLILIVFCSYYLSKIFTSNSSNNLLKFVMIVILIEIALILREQKAEVILFPTWCAITIAFRKAKSIDNILKKGAIVILILVFLNLFWNLTLLVYPKFITLQNSTFFNAALIRLNGQQMSGIDNALVNVLNNETDHTYQLIIGKGLGSSIPPYNFRLMIRSGNSLDSFLYIFKYSSLYYKYPYNYNFFISAKNCLIIDGGYIGIAIFYLLILLNGYRAFMVLRCSKEIQAISVGAIGLWQSIELVYRTINYNIVVQFLPIAATFLLFGIVNYEYKKLKLPLINQKLAYILSAKSMSKFGN